MRDLDGTTDSRYMSLSKLQEMKHKEAWSTVVHGTAELVVTERLKDSHKRSTAAAPGLPGAR